MVNGAEINRKEAAAEKMDSEMGGGGGGGGEVSMAVGPPHS